MIKFENHLGAIEISQDYFANLVGHAASECFGVGAYCWYVFFIILVYNLLFFTLETFNFFNWVHWLECIGGSTVITYMLVMATESFRK